MKKLYLLALTLLMVFGSLNMVWPAAAEAATVNANVDVYKDIDVVLSLGSSSQNINDFESKLKEKLQEMGIPLDKVKISSLEKSEVSAENTFAWKTYDHETTAWNYTTDGGTFSPGAPNSLNPPEGNTGSPYKHIWVYNGGQQITFYGYESPAYRDFMYMPNDSSTEKTFTFTMDDANIQDHSMKGGGFLFNTKITNLDQYALASSPANLGSIVTSTALSNQAISGYELLMIKSGSGSYPALFEVNNMTLANFHNNAGTLTPLTQNTSSVLSGVHHIKVQISGSKFQMWDTVGATTNTMTYDLPQDFGSYGFGPIAEYNAHGCTMLSWFNFENLQMETTSVKKFIQVLREPEWRDNSDKFVVNLDDNNIPDFDDDKDLGEILTRMDNENMHYIGWGTNSNKAQAQTFIGKNGDRGTFVNRDAMPNYDDQINAIAEYIKGKYNSSIERDVQYIPMGGTHDVVVTPSSEGTDTNGKWKVHHDPSVYDNTYGPVPYNDEPLNDLDVKFDKPGKYDIYYEDNLVKTIYVHRNPVSQFDVAVDGSNHVTITDHSYDPDDPSYVVPEDHQKWRYKEVSATDWTEGKPTTLEPNKNYIIESSVEDEQGGWSAPYSRYVSTTGDSAIKPIANFTVSPSTIDLNTSNTKVQWNDLSYDPNGNAIGTRTWTVTKDGQTVTVPIDSSTNTIDFSGMQPGEYKITLKVTNGAVESELFTKTIQVIKDETPPTVSVDLNHGSISVKDSVYLTYSDEGGSGLAYQQYALTHDSSAPSEGDWGAKSNNDVRKVTFNSLGTWYLHYKAIDNSGNVLTAGYYGPYTLLPAAPAGINANGIGSTGVTLNWGAVTGAESYKIYDNGALVASTVTGATYTFTNLDPGSSHNYTVTAVGGGSESDPSDSFQVTLVPGIPASVETSHVTDNGVTLDWATAPGAESYRIYDNGLLVATVTGTTYGAAGLQPGTSHSYTVTAVNHNGESMASAPIPFTTLGLNVDSSSYEMPIGLTHQTVLTFIDHSGQTYNVTQNANYSIVGGEGIVAVSAGGLVTAVHAGNTVISAVYQGLSAIVTVRVPEPTIDGLLVDEGAMTVSTGYSHQIVTQATRFDQSKEDVSDQAVYRSSDTSVVTVDAHGNLTAVGPGTATITVVYGGKTTTVTVHVEVGEPSFALSLSTTPASVVGDGHSQVKLEARAVATNGDPVAGVPVKFHFGNGTEADQTASTNAQGIATVTFTAPAIVGTTAVNEVITAMADDPKNPGLQVQKSIAIHYMPASITGVLIDKVTGQPMVGATITVTKDFNGDGIIDFTATVVTGADGSYSIVVPRGDSTYTLNVSTTVQVGDQTIPFTTTQTAQVGTLHGTGEAIPSSNKLSGQLFLAQHSNSPSGTTNIDDAFNSSNISVNVQGLNGNTFQNLAALDADGRFNVDNVPQGQYRITYQIKAPDGSVLAGPSATVEVDQNGEVSVVYSLIDPYGVVSDKSGRPISGVTVKLYWADTPANAAQGHTAGTLVNLPELPTFAPNKNHNPQVTNAAGEYAWMVFPDGDYYIVASRAGYEDYSTLKDKPNAPAENGSDSYIQDGIIHVGRDIVLYNFSMNTEQSGDTFAGGGGVVSAPSKMTAYSTTENETMLAWEPVNNATAYNIYDNGALIASNVADTGYHVTDLKAGTEHHFTVKAIVNGAEVATSYSIDLKLPTNSATSPQSTEQAGTSQHEKYIEGYPDATFKPGRDVTRAEVAAMLTRVLKLSASQASTAAYGDIEGAYWGTPYIQAVTAAGMMEGYPDGTFRPQQSMTREEMAIVAARIKQLQKKGTDSFTDTADSFDRQSIAAVSAAGIMDGYPDGTFRPKNNISRAEIVAVINRMTNRGPLTGITSPAWPDVASTDWAFGDIEEASTDHQYRVANQVETWAGELNK